MADDAMMKRPSFRYEFNLNTVVNLIMIGGMLYAAGTVKATMEQGIKQNREQIADLRADANDLRKNVEAIRLESKTYMTLTYRVDRLENGATVLDNTQKDMEKTINQVASDVRVMRQIVERLDRTNRRFDVPSEH